MHRSTSIAFAPWLALLGASGCAHRADHPFNPPVPDTHAQAREPGDYDFARQAGTPAHSTPDQVGLATWYGAKFAGHKTSNGERFDPGAMTAAHRKLPFNTWVEVRRVDTGRTVRVRINDRGPWGDDAKIIDLSRAAADALEMRGEGVVKVELYVVGGPSP